MNKYKNKNGIELSITSNDQYSVLVREVIEEACKILTTYNRDDKISMDYTIRKTKDFLETNFNLKEGNKDE